MKINKYISYTNPHRINIIKLLENFLWHYLQSKRLIAAHLLSMNYKKMAEILPTAKGHPNMATCWGRELASWIS